MSSVMLAGACAATPWAKRAVMPAKAPACLETVDNLMAVCGLCGLRALVRRTQITEEELVTNSEIKKVPFYKKILLIFDINHN